MDIKIKRGWKERSRYFKDTLKGVMLASFPDFVNKFFHEWELEIIKEFFPKNKKNINVLDIGCGYGRLSFALSKEFKNAKYYGIDISEEFVKLFNKKLKGKGKAVLGSANNLPFTKKIFDFYIIVTSIIYMQDEEILKLIQKIKETAKEDALVVVIENNTSGVNYITGFGLLPLIKKIMKRKNQFDIKSRAFKDGKILNYFKGFYLCEKRYCRLLTLFLPVLLILNKFMLNNFSRINYDINLPFLPSLLTAHIFKVKPNE